MKSFKRNAFTLAMMAFSLCLGSSKAMAQSVVQGKFNLPVQAKWGALVLEPGAYALRIERGSAGPNLIFLRGPHGTQARLLGAYSTVKESSRSYLRLTNSDGVVSVREFYCGALGHAYQYHAPKVMHLEARNNNPQETLIAIKGSN